MKFNPYLNFNGNTEEAFEFYRSVFGGEFTSVMRLKDFPETSDVPEDVKDKIMHISLPVGEGTVLMATDAIASMGQKLVEGNNHYIIIDVDTQEEADRLFKLLSEGGTVEMPMEKTFWGAYFGSFKDRYGINWMINYTFPTQ